MAILKGSTPTSRAQIVQDPGDPEHPLVTMVRECGDAAARHGGSPEDVATGTIACFILKVAEAITAPRMGDPNPNPGSGETKDPAKG
jgi:hypothetical protein